MKEVEIGKVYTDRVTGYKGVAVVQEQWMEGCLRIGLQAKIDKDGNIPNILFFDEPALLPKVVKGKKPGGRHGVNPKQRY